MGDATVKDINGYPRRKMEVKRERIGTAKS